MKLLAFAASLSKESINKKLVNHAVTLLDGVTVEKVDLCDYELPIFSADREEAMGQPELAKAFVEKIGSSDGVIISFAEYNGSYTAAYKNLFDWCSRIRKDVYQNKPMVLLSTSPGPGGGARVLASALDSMPVFGGIVKGSFSLPSFHDNFNAAENKLSDPALAESLKQAVNKIKE